MSITVETDAEVTDVKNAIHPSLSSCRRTFLKNIRRNSQLNNLKIYSKVWLYSIDVFEN